MLACAWPIAAHAQVQLGASLGVVSENRYRGLATEDRGPIVRATAMADAAAGAYAGVGGLWRTRDAELASAEAIVGWSGRFASPGLDPAWGWDVALHRTHYGEGSRYDFTEVMAGLLAPGASARVWWSPHYFGGPYTSTYLDLAASRELGEFGALLEHVRAFAHVGVMRYGASGGWRPAGRTDATAGLAWASGDRELRVARDGLVAGDPLPGTSERRRRANWLLAASVAF